MLGQNDPDGDYRSLFLDGSRAYSLTGAASDLAERDPAWHSGPSVRRGFREQERPVKPSPIITAPADERDQNRYLVLLLLWLVYVMHGVDRTVMYVVLEPISLEFGLSDSEIGLVAGLAYAVPYAIAGVPLGAMADRVTRKRLLALLVGVWSGMTMLATLTWNMVSLFAVRTLVGAAEGGAAPAMLSIISDSVPPRVRPGFVSALMTGPHAGLMAGSVIAGLVTAHFGWRAALIVAGVPGLIVALALIVVLREPRRGRFDNECRHLAGAPSLRETVQFLFSASHRLLVLFGITLGAFVVVAFSTFMTKFLIHSHGMTIDQAGMVIGFGLGLAAAAGGLTGGLLTTRFVHLGSAPVLLGCGIALAASVPLGLAALTAESALWVIVALSAWAFVATMYLGPSYSVMIELLQPRMRGTAMAMVAVLTHLLGSTSPWMVGRLSEWLSEHGDDANLRHAMIASLAVSVLQAALFLQAARRTRVLSKQTDRARQANSG